MLNKAVLASAVKAKIEADPRFNLGHDECVFGFIIDVLIDCIIDHIKNFAVVTTTTGSGTVK